MDAAYTAAGRFGALTSSWEATPTTTPDHPAGTAAPFHRTSPTETGTGRHIGLMLVGLLALGILLTQVSFRGQIEVRG